MYLNFMIKPRYIILEGVDASGKTTAAKFLTDWLHSQNIDAIYTGHPGSTDFGKKIRGITHDPSEKLHHITEAMIFAADQNEFFEQILKPKLSAGSWVIADRSNFVSGLAYQIASGCSLNELDQIQDSIPNPPKADLLVILHADREVIAKRSQQRGNKDRFEDLMREDSYYSKVVDAYSKMLNHDSEIEKRLLKFVRSTTTVPGPVPRCVGVETNRSEQEVFDDLKILMNPLMRV